MNWYYEEGDEDMLEAAEEYSDLMSSDVITSYKPYDTAKKLDLFFDTEQFSNLEIAEIIGVLSDLYTSIGGDRLIIKGTQNLEYQVSLEPLTK